MNDLKIINQRRRCSNCRKFLSNSNLKNINHSCNPPMLGKHHSEKTIEKMRESRKGLGCPWNKGLPKELTSMFGKHHSEKTKEKIRGIIKQQWKTKINYGMKGKKLTEDQKRKISEKNIGKKYSIESRLKMRISRLKYKHPLKDTAIEILLQNALKSNGIDFQTHKPILNLTQPDIFIEPNICIYADGCYWHGCEQCLDRNKFNGMQRKQIVKDVLITQKLINENYVVLRFWEHEINNNLENCTNMILSKVKSSIPFVKRI